MNQDISISAVKANLWAIPIMVVLAALALLPFYLLYGNAAMGNFGKLHWFIPALIIGIIIHEGIHAFTWMVLGNIPFSKMKFGFIWKTLTPYAHCKEAMQKKHYTVGVLMPLFVVGVIPYLIGLAFGINSIMWFGVVFIISAAGDLLVYWLMRNVDDNQLVRDHPSRVGCIVCAPEE